MLDSAHPAVRSGEPVHEQGPLLIGYIDESVRGTATGLMYVVASSILIEGNDDEARDKLRKLRLLGHERCCTCCIYSADAKASGTSSSSPATRC